MFMPGSVFLFCFFFQKSIGRVEGLCALQASDHPRVRCQQPSSSGTRLCVLGKGPKVSELQFPGENSVPHGSSCENQT